MPRFVEADPPSFVDRDPPRFVDTPRFVTADPPKFPDVDAPRLAEPVTSRLISPDSSELPSISLADLKDAGITFDEDDAVAIGQALCRAYMTARVLHRIIPESGVAGVSSPVTLDTVFLEASGHVSITVEGPYDVPLAIQSIGHVLSDILPPDESLFLRKKIISRALASPSQFVTLDELAEALALYERPDRRQLLQALYARREKRPLPRAPVVQEIVPFTPPPAWTPPPKNIQPPRSRHRPIAVAAAITAGLVIGIGGGFVAGRLRSDKRAVPVPVVTALPEQEPVTAEGNSKDSTPGQPQVARERPRAGSPLPAERSLGRAEPPSLSDPRISTGQPLSSTGLARGAVPETAVVPPARGIDGVGRSNDNIALPIDPAALPSGNSAAARSGPLSGVLATPTGTASIYGQEDIDVRPPTVVFPQMLSILRPTSPGVRLDALTIAIVVNADGTVDSVRGVNAPQNIGELVLLTQALSAVKSWRFSPATKDGAPVRYRHIIPLRMLTHHTEP